MLTELYQIVETIVLRLLQDIVLNQSFKERVAPKQIYIRSNQNIILLLLAMQVTPKDPAAEKSESEEEKKE